VLVPVSPLRRAKTRLAAVFEPSERAGLVLAMMQDVIEAIEGAELLDDVLILSDDPRVESIAEDRGLRYITEHPSGDLNTSLRLGTEEYLSLRKNAPLLILPVDVPLVRSETLDSLVGEALTDGRPSVVACPSENRGTNALLRKPPNVISPSFGPLSFERHREASERKGVRFVTHRSPELALDIDCLEDIQRHLMSDRSNHSIRFLRSTGLGKR
jgi:2-phospho-L-lactate guanylyltransferase